MLRDKEINLLQSLYENVQLKIINAILLGHRRQLQ